MKKIFWIIALLIYFCSSQFIVKAGFFSPDAENCSNKTIEQWHEKYEWKYNCRKKNNVFVASAIIDVVTKKVGELPKVLTPQTTLVTKYISNNNYFFYNHSPPDLLDSGDHPLKIKKAKVLLI